MNNKKEKEVMEEKKEAKKEENTLDEIWGNMEQFVDQLFEYHRAEIALGRYLHH